MAPKSILAKMRLGLGTAGVALALGYADCGWAAGERSSNPPSNKSTTSKQTPSLTKAQLKTLRSSIPLLGHETFKTRHKAYRSILALGKGALESLRFALKNNTDPEIKTSLNRLIVEMSPKPAVVEKDKRVPCPKCSRG